MSITPFAADKALDLDRLRDHMQFLSSAGVGVYVASQGSGEGDLLTFDGGRLEIDNVRHEIRVGGEVRGVTPSEFDLLVGLAQYPGRVYARAEIAYRLRGYEYEGDERVVDVHVRNLRRKIEDDPASPRLIQTVRGVGYRLGVEPS